jgi:hypothetical protein
LEKSIAQIALTRSERLVHLGEDVPREISSHNLSHSFWAIWLASHDMLCGIAVSLENSKLSKRLILNPNVKTAMIPTTMKDAKAEEEIVSMKNLNQGILLFLIENMVFSLLFENSGNDFFSFPEFKVMSLLS